MNHPSIATCITCLLLLALSQAANAAARSDVVLQGGAASRKLLDGVPVHGNWCGPGHGKPGLPAVDDLDECCKAHDTCYDDVAYGDCNCDMKLVECAYYNTKAGTWELTKRAKRKAVQLYFSQAAQLDTACRAGAKAQATKLKLPSW